MTSAQWKCRKMVSPWRASFLTPTLDPQSRGTKFSNYVSFFNIELPIMPADQDDMVVRPSPSALTFDLVARCSVRSNQPFTNTPRADEQIQTTKARASNLHLPHGPVQLPMFMPVATQASLKGLTPKQLDETSCRLCLNNTYHL